MRASHTRYAAAGVLMIALLLASLGCGKRAVGIVNGTKITQDAFYQRLQRFPVDPRAQFPTPIIQQAATAVLNQMITEQLLMDLAKKEGVEPTQTELDARKKELNSYLTDRGTDLLTMLHGSGMQPKELDQRLMPQLAQINVLAKYEKLSEATVKNTYDEIIHAPLDQRIRSIFYIPEAVHVYAIINPSKAKIDDAKKQLDNNVSFPVVVEQYSSDSSKDRRGEIGWINKPDAVRPALQGVPPAIYEKAFSTKAGQTTAPFKAGNDWVILRVQEHRDGKIQPFDHVKSMISDRLLQVDAQRNKKLQEVFTNLRKNAKIDITLPGYRELFKNFQQQLNKPVGPGPQSSAGAPAGGE